MAHELLFCFKCSSTTNRWAFMFSAPSISRTICWLITGILCFPIVTYMNISEQNNSNKLINAQPNTIKIKLCFFYHFPFHWHLLVSHRFLLHSNYSDQMLQFFLPMVGQCLVICQPSVAVVYHFHVLVVA